MITVLLVDDHAIVRRGLSQLLEEGLDAPVRFLEAGNFQEALGHVAGNRIDIVLLDIAMPGRGGLDLLKTLRAENPDLPVMVISMYPEEQYAVRALRAGAAAYLTKESAPDELIAAVRKVLGGGKFVSAAVSELLAAEVSGSRKRGEMLHASLSDREFQIACLIASGQTATEIADRLALSVKTVSTYRTRLLAKMDLKNNSELTTYLIRHGIVG